MPAHPRAIESADTMIDRHPDLHGLEAENECPNIALNGMLSSCTCQ